MFEFNLTSGVVNSINITAVGQNYVAGDFLLFDGTLFSGTSGVDDISFLVSTFDHTLATVSGGRCNTSSGVVSTIGGGYLNTSSGQYSTISGGLRNTSSGYYSTVGGGWNNTSINGCSAILGGQNNTTQHDCSFIVGSGISSTAANTLHINCLNIRDLPDETAIGLPLGTVFYDSTTCNLCVCL